MEERMENVLSVEQLAEYFHVSKDTIRRWRDKGLPLVRLGIKSYILESDFIAWFKNLSKQGE